MISSAGQKDQFIALYRREEVQNQYGTLERQDVLLHECWAEVRPMSGRERDRQHRTEASADYVFVLFTDDVHESDLREDDFIRWDGDDFNIRFAAGRGDRAMDTIIEAERGVAT